MSDSSTAVHVASSTTKNGAAPLSEVEKTAPATAINAKKEIPDSDLDDNGNASSSSPKKRFGLVISLGVLSVALFVVVVVFWNQVKNRDATIMEHNNHIDQIQNSRGLLQAQVDDAKASAAGIQKQMDEAKVVALAARNEFEKAKAETTKIQAKLDQERGISVAFQTQMEEAKVVSLKHQGEVETAHAQTSVLQIQLSKATSDVADLKSQLAECKTQIADLQAKLDKAGMDISQPQKPAKK